MNRCLIILFVLNAACSVSPKTFDTPVAIPDAFSLAGKEPLSERWWLSFNDNELNRLIDTGLAQNLDLHATLARLDQAKAVARKAGSELIPAVDGVGNANRRIEQNFDLDNFTLALAASYEVDLWGRIRAGMKASELDVDSAREDIHTAAIALTAEIAARWYQLVEQNKLFNLLSEQIRINGQYVDLVTVRFQGGQATAADVFQQRQLLESVIGDRFTVQANIRVLKNQLAILTGQAPEVFDIEPPDHFPEIGDLPATGLTTELIQRRPDIKKAYFRLQAADLRVASAVADRFPKISLSAGINTNAPDLQSLFNNWMATLAGNLVLPIIDGGRRVAEVDRNKALAAEAFNLYGQRILQSIQEVENALVQEARQHERLASLEQQLEYLNDANMNISLRSAYGAFDFLRVLSTLNSLQAMQRSLLRAERELVDFRINLYRALAGGWPVVADEIIRSDANG